MAKTKTASKPAKKTTQKTADKAQFERFVEAARKIGVEEDPKALDRAFDRIAPARNSNKS
jgi:hypothetical protein